MALADLIRGASRRLATATPATAATASARAVDAVRGPVAPVAGVAVAKPRSVQSARWLLHFDGAEPGVIAAAPPVGHAAVLAMYPEAIAAEPMSAPLPAELPPAMATMFARCVEGGLYMEEERPVLRAMYAADPFGTRAMVATMHARIGRCHRCRHIARPGLSDGYCTQRTDLPIAYGLLRVLPSDGGAGCSSFAAA
jgi:hypothetical protein